MAPRSPALGTVSGSIVGGLVMAILNNGLILKGIGADSIQMIKGIVLLLAVALDVYNKRQGRFSVIGSITKGFRGSGPSTPSEPPAQKVQTPVVG